MHSIFGMQLLFGVKWNDIVLASYNYFLCNGYLIML